MQRKTTGVSRTGYSRARALILGLSLLLLSSPGYTERSGKQRGVTIPEATVVFASGLTRIDASGQDAAMLVTLDEAGSWDLLNRVLSGLRISPLQEDRDQGQLVTDWILWTYDKRTDSGSSKPPRRGLSRSYERHRFQFTVSNDTANQGSVIRVEDFARQKEVDITPDSEYSWLEWKDAPAQQNAAVTFLRRLQGDFEAAVSTRLLVPGTGSARMVEPFQQTGDRVRSHAPEPQNAASAAAPLAVSPVEAQAAIPAQTAAEPPPADIHNAPPSATVATVPVTTGSGALAAPVAGLTPEVTSRAGAPRPPNSPGQASTGVQHAPPPPAVVDQASEPPAPVERISPPATNDRRLATASPVPQLVRQGGLIVDADWGSTWPALLRALADMGVAVETSDERQHMLSTAWIDSFYDKKNQRFSIRSKEELKWAFNFMGKGRQRHRFQLILIPVDNGLKTMIYAYHTGFQEETDQTPDSSQTLLYWKDHDTDPDIALAFLRNLRIVVNQ